MTNDQIREVVVGTLTRIAPEIEAGALQSGVPLRDQLDIDSMDFLNFIIALHERLGVDIPEIDYAKLSSVDDVVRYLASKLAAREQRPAG
jgi:acyl carrier protein